MLMLPLACRRSPDPACMQDVKHSKEVHDIHAAAEVFNPETEQVTQDSRFGVGSERQAGVRAQSVLHGESSPLRKCNDPYTSRRLKGPQSSCRSLICPGPKSTTPKIRLPPSAHPHKSACVRASCWRRASFISTRRPLTVGRSQVYKYLQVFSACAVSFAHGANDVANAVGPFAAIWWVASGALHCQVHCDFILMMLLWVLTCSRWPSYLPAARCRALLHPTQRPNDTCPPAYMHAD